MTYKGSIDIEGHSGDMYTHLFVIGIYPGADDPFAIPNLAKSRQQKKPMHFELQFKAATSSRTTTVSSWRITTAPK